jgi:hypothetical protein
MMEAPPWTPDARPEPDSEAEKPTVEVHRTPDGRYVFSEAGGDGWLVTNAVVEPKP